MRKPKSGRKPPRQYALVRFNFRGMAKRFWASYPFTKEAVYIFLGEIPNMPGHCVIAEHPSGNIYSGYHTENFIEIEKRSKERSKDTHKVA